MSEVATEATANDDPTLVPDLMKLLRRIADAFEAAKKKEEND